MEPAARGPPSGGGLTIRLLPGDDPSDANEYIDIAIATSLGHGRNAVLARTADGVVGLGGGLGTLSEIALALRNGRPTIGIQTWRFDRQGRTEPELPTAGNVNDALSWLFARMGGTA